MADFGILAIWNDVASGHEADLETWFQGEHLVERLAVPGFLYGRRHQAISGASAFSNFYLVEAPAVLTSKPYLERLDNPTPMTKKIMSDIFKNVTRTVCHRTLRCGAFGGAYAVMVRFAEAPDEGALAMLLDSLVADTGIAGGEIWIASDSGGQPVSMEEKLRGGDKKIKACLMVDTLHAIDAERLGARFDKEFPGTQVGVFRVLCQLGRGDL